MALMVLLIVFLVGIVQSEQSEESCGHNVESGAGELLSEIHTESSKQVFARFRAWLIEMLSQSALLDVWRNIQPVNLGTWEKPF